MIFYIIIKEINPILYSGYALKDVAVKYIMDTNKEVFANLGRHWDGDENSYIHVRLSFCCFMNSCLCLVS